MIDEERIGILSVLTGQVTDGGHLLWSQSTSLSNRFEVTRVVTQDDLHGTVRRQVARSIVFQQVAEFLRDADEK